MTSRFAQTIAAAIAILMVAASPCAAALMPSPASCMMAACGDGPSVGSVRGTCCCSHEPAQVETSVSVSLTDRPLAGHHARPAIGLDVQPAGSDESGGFCAAPPTPVPLFLLHSSLLI